MAWGGNDGAVDRWIKQLKEDDPSLVSLHILSFRRISSSELGRIFEALSYNTHLRILYVSGHSLDATSTDCLSESLTKNDTLQELNLGNDTFGKDSTVFQLFCEGLAANEGLHKLDLENKGLLSNTHNKYESTRALADALSKNKHLEEINLARNELDDDALDILAPALAGLHKVNLSMNMIGPKGAQAIARQLMSTCSNVKELDLSDNPLLEGTSDLAAALKTNTALISLKLVDVVSDSSSELSALPPAAINEDESDKKLDEEADKAKRTDTKRILYGNDLAKALGQALESNTSLKKIWLDNNAIESSALEVLAKHLPKSSVDELKLRQNLIDDEGALLLANATHKLLHLELGENSIQAKGFGALLNTRLQYLGLFNNTIGGFGADPTLLPELLNSGISRLDVGCNHIIHEDLEAMVEVLLKNGVPKLTLLEMGGNVEDKEIEQWDITISRLLKERDLEIVWKRKPTQMESMPPPQM